MKIGISFMIDFVINRSMCNYISENNLIFEWKYPIFPDKGDLIDLPKLIPIESLPSKEDLIRAIENEVKYYNYELLTFPTKEDGRDGIIKFFKGLTFVITDFREFKMINNELIILYVIKLT